MPKEKRSWFRLIFFGLIVLMMTASFTDADFLDREDVIDNTFQALTLDFSNRNTANLTEKTLLFNIFGLVPGGFDVASVRLRNEAELPFTYQALVQVTAGNSSLCDAAELRLLKDWQTQYQGGLSTFQYTGQLEPAASEDWVLALSLPSSAPAQLINQTCSFNIVITTLSQPGGSPFSDQEVMQNQISTGGWAGN